MNTYIKAIALIVLSCFCQQALAQYRDYKLSTLEYVCESEDDAEHSDAQNELAIRYKNGVRGATQNHGKAFYWFTKAAKNGNKYAMNNLAYCYLEGRGTTKNTAQAIYWLEESANRYFPGASATLGQWYLFGTNTSKNYTKAVRYLKDAAFAGDGPSMNYLAYCYYSGYGVEPNAEKLKFWAKRAINQEQYYSYYLLGSMYKDGKIVPKDESQAYLYYTLGKNHDDSACALELGNMYEEGAYLEQDYSKAEENYIIAARQGRASALDRLNHIAFLYADGDGLRKDYDKALSIINLVLEMAEYKEFFLDSKGQLYLKMGRIEDARKAWLDVLRIKPSFYSDYEDTALNKYMTSHPQ